MRILTSNKASGAARVGSAMKVVTALIIGAMLAGGVAAANTVGDTSNCSPTPGIDICETEELQADRGPRGKRGKRGKRGPIGDPGEDGLDGEDGKDGKQGISGPKGDTGDTGPAGAKGAKGDTGPAGAKGAKGDTGPAGAKGIKGDTGAKGEKGDTGATPTLSLYIVTETATAKGGANEVLTLTPRCDKGDKATGGGYQVGTFGTMEVAQNNFQSGNTAWQVSAITNANSTNGVKLFATVSCLKVG